MWFKLISTDYQEAASLSHNSCNIYGTQFIYKNIFYYTTDDIIIIIGQIIYYFVLL